jgi:hypothetical protein
MYVPSRRRGGRAFLMRDDTRRQILYRRQLRSLRSRPSKAAVGTVSGAVEANFSAMLACSYSLPLSQAQRRNQTADD